MKIFKRIDIHRQKMHHRETLVCLQESLRQSPNLIFSYKLDDHRRLYRFMADLVPTSLTQE